MTLVLKPVKFKYKCSLTKPTSYMCNLCSACSHNTFSISGYSGLAVKGLDSVLYIGVMTLSEQPQRQDLNADFCF